MAAPEESGQWPLCRIEAIDPYPFHGLVYRVAGGSVEWLDPGAGRPPVVRPDVIFESTYLTPIYPEVDGALWDIGKPDPPAGPAVTAAGGTSLGRRIVSHATYMPARLGGRTYRVGVSALQVDDGTQFLVRLMGRPATVFATIPDSAFGLDTVALFTESGVPISASDVGRIGLGLQHVTPDGVRRLFIARATPRPGLITTSWVGAVVGFVEVVLSLREDGSIHATANVIKGAADCLGTFTGSGTNDIKRSRSVPGSAPCSTAYELVPQDFPTAGVSGTTHRVEQRTGLVTGALYVDGEVRYFTLDVARERTESASFSRSGYAGVPNYDEEGNYTCDFTGVDTSPPISRTRSLVINESMTAHFNGHSITVERTYVQEVAGSENPGTPGSLTGTSFWESNLAGSVVSATSGISSLSMMNLDWVFEGGPPAGALVMPTAAELFESETRRARFRTWRSFQGFAVLLSSTAQGRQSPMLCPAGVIGSWMDIATIRTDLGSPLYDAAYNPITEQGIRACDLPAGRTLVGWL